MADGEISEIVNLINLYATAVDTQQWELLDRVFTEDVVTDFGGPAVFEGLAMLKQAFAAIHAPFARTLHMTTNHQVRVSGDRASCLSYVHGRFIRNVEGGDLFESIGWYDDSLVRTQGGWRIRHRACRSVWAGGNPAVMRTSPDVDVEPPLYSLADEAGSDRVAHLQALLGA